MSKHNRRSLQRENDPVHACGVRLGAGVARSYGEAAQIGAADGVKCLVGKDFRVETCIGEDCVASCEVADGRRSELVGASHRTGNAVGICQVVAWQRRATRVMPHSVYGGGDVPFDFIEGVSGEGMGEIFDNE